MIKNVAKLLTISSIVFYACETKNPNSDANNNTPSTIETKTENDAADTIAQTFKIDTSKSSIKWLGKKVTGKHNGSIKFNNGTLNTKGEMIADGQLEINMASIINEDLTDSEMNKKLIGHLRSEDFFSVDKFPTATFDVTRVDAGEKEDDAIVTGNLTLKGKAAEISIPAHVDVDKDKINVTGKTTIDRTKWDIRYGSGKFFENLGDKAIYDEVELEFNLEGTK